MENLFTGICAASMILLVMKIFIHAKIDKKLGKNVSFWKLQNLPEAFFPYDKIVPHDLSKMKALCNQFYRFTIYGIVLMVVIRILIALNI